MVHWKNRGGWKQNRGYSSAVIHPVLANFLQRPWHMFHGTKTQFLFLRNLDGLATKVWGIVCHLNILDFVSTTTTLGATTLWHIDTWHTLAHPHLAHIEQPHLAHSVQQSTTGTTTLWHTWDDHTLVFEKCGENFYRNIDHSDIFGVNQ